MTLGYDKDWYSRKFYKHFDNPLNKESALSYVRGFISYYSAETKNFSYNPKHQFSFLPLIHYNKEYKHYNNFLKIRKICYPSHRDGYVYAYYANVILAPKYERLLSNIKLSDCVCAYRSDIGNNYTIASDIFRKIKIFENCTVLTFDISSFFDNIDHENLKKLWCYLLGQEKLPLDHYKVYKSITKYSYISKKELNKYNDINIHLVKKLNIITNKINRGIPQGTQISAILSNIYMLDFDKKMYNEFCLNGGIYRRYADDILLMFPSLECDTNTISKKVSEFLKQSGKNLELNNGKTEVIKFKNGKIYETKPLQYLGLTYDGNKVLIRNSSLSKYYIKLIRFCRKAYNYSRNTKDYIITKQGKKVKPRTNIIFKCKLYTKYSQYYLKSNAVKYLSRRNQINKFAIGSFWSYVKNMERSISQNNEINLNCGFRHQLRKHLSIINKEIKGQKITRSKKRNANVY